MKRYEKRSILSMANGNEETPGAKMEDLNITIDQVSLIGKDYLIAGGNCQLSQFMTNIVTGNVRIKKGNITTRTDQKYSFTIPELCKAIREYSTSDIIGATTSASRWTNQIFDNHAIPKKYAYALIMDCPEVKPNHAFDIIHDYLSDGQGNEYLTPELAKKLLKSCIKEVSMKDQLVDFFENLERKIKREGDSSLSDQERFNRGKRKDYLIDMILSSQNLLSLFDDTNIDERTRYIEQKKEELKELEASMSQGNFSYLQDFSTYESVEGYKTSFMNMMDQLCNSGIDWKELANPNRGDTYNLQQKTIDMHTPPISQSNLLKQVLIGVDNDSRIDSIAEWIRTTNPALISRLYRIHSRFPGDTEDWKSRSSATDFRNITDYNTQKSNRERLTQARTTERVNRDLLLHAVELYQYIVYQELGYRYPDDFQGDTNIIHHGSESTSTQTITTNRSLFEIGEQQFIDISRTSLKQAEQSTHQSYPSFAASNAIAEEIVKEIPSTLQGYTNQLFKHQEQLTVPQVFEVIESLSNKIQNADREFEETQISSSTDHQESNEQNDEMNLTTAFEYAGRLTEYFNDGTPMSPLEDQEKAINKGFEAIGYLMQYDQRMETHPVYDHWNTFENKMKTILSWGKSIQPIDKHDTWMKFFSRKMNTLNQGYLHLQSAFETTINTKLKDSPHAAQFMRYIQSLQTGSLKRHVQQSSLFGQGIREEVRRSYSDPRSSKAQSILFPHEQEWNRSVQATQRKTDNDRNDITAGLNWIESRGSQSTQNGVLSSVTLGAAGLRNGLAENTYGVLQGLGGMVTTSLHLHDDQLAGYRSVMDKRMQAYSIPTSTQMKGAVFTNTINGTTDTNREALFTKSGYGVGFLLTLMGGASATKAGIQTTKRGAALAESQWGATIIGRGSLWTNSFMMQVSKQFSKASQMGGVDKWQAYVYALTQAGVASSLELLAPNRLMGIGPLSMSKEAFEHVNAWKIASYMFIEIGEEIVQELSQAEAELQFNSIFNDLRGKEFQESMTWNEYFETIAVTILTTGLVSTRGASQMRNHDQRTITQQEKTARHIQLVKDFESRRIPTPIAAGVTGKLLREGFEKLLAKIGEQNIDPTFLSFLEGFYGFNGGRGSTALTGETLGPVETNKNSIFDRGLVMGMITTLSVDGLKDLIAKHNNLLTAENIPTILTEVITHFQSLTTIEDVGAAARIVFGLYRSELIDNEGNISSLNEADIQLIFTVHTLTPEQAGIDTNGKTPDQIQTELNTIKGLRLRSLSVFALGNNLINPEAVQFIGALLQLGVCGQKDILNDITFLELKYLISDKEGVVHAEDIWSITDIEQFVLLIGTYDQEVQRTILTKLVNNENLIFSGNTEKEEALYHVLSVSLGLGHSGRDKHMLSITDLLGEIFYAGRENETQLNRRLYTVLNTYVERGQITPEIYDTMSQNSHFVAGLRNSYGQPGKMVSDDLLNSIHDALFDRLCNDTDNLIHSIIQMEFATFLLEDVWMSGERLQHAKKTLHAEILHPQKRGILWSTYLQQLSNSQRERIKTMQPTFEEDLRQRAIGFTNPNNKEYDNAWNHDAGTEMFGPSLPEHSLVSYDMLLAHQILTQIEQGDFVELVYKQNTQIESADGAANIAMLQVVGLIIDGIAQSGGFKSIDGYQKFLKRLSTHLAEQYDINHYNPGSEHCAYLPVDLQHYIEQDLEHYTGDSDLLDKAFTLLYTEVMFMYLLKTGSTDIFDSLIQPHLVGRFPKQIEDIDITVLDLQEVLQMLPDVYYYESGRLVTELSENNIEDTRMILEKSQINTTNNSWKSGIVAQILLGRTDLVRENNGSNARDEVSYFDDYEIAILKQFGILHQNRTSETVEEDAWNEVKRNLTQILGNEDLNYVHVLMTSVATDNKAALTNYPDVVEYIGTLSDLQRVMLARWLLEDSGLGKEIIQAHNQSGIRKKKRLLQMMGYGTEAIQTLLQWRVCGKTKAKENSQSLYPHIEEHLGANNINENQAQRLEYLYRNVSLRNIQEFLTVFSNADYTLLTNRTIVNFIGKFGDFIELQNEYSINTITELENIIQGIPSYSDILTQQVLYKDLLPPVQFVLARSFFFESGHCGAAPDSIKESITNTGGILIRGSNTVVYTKSEQNDTTSLIYEGSQRTGYGDLSAKYLVAVNTAHFYQEESDQKILTEIQSRYPYITGLSRENGFLVLETDEELHFREWTLETLVGLNIRQGPLWNQTRYNSMLDIANKYLPAFLE